MFQRPSEPRSAVLIALGACLAAWSVVPGVQLVLPKLIRWDTMPDFTIFWTAGKLALDGGALYDPEVLTRAQAHVRQPPGLLPFPYPPTALPLFAPFALLPMWGAYWLFAGLSAVAFWSGARRVTSGWPLVLALVCTPALIVLTLGQTSLLIGAAILWGLSLLEHRPRLAGFLLGMAVSIKPQTALLVPLALLSGRHWSAFAGAILGGLAIMALSLPFGIQRWPEWLASLPQMQAIATGYGLDSDGATPAMLARALGLAALPFQLAGVALGSLVVWRGFGSNDLNTRILALACGSILAAPYAMRYEIVLLAPVAAAAILSGTWRGMVIGLPLLAVNVFTAVPALIMSALAMLSNGIPFERRAGSPSGPATGLPAGSSRQ